ncbi:hypothetical protein [Burkholderia metallica]|uniref:hypothetical protein n=1 Tax=Burkholderia metallica TaxID=488729 RepID=UPI001CF525D8|nr:hypothetical protein [Burkholderia metallica]MCA8018118.1 hypothetical protein [Burkholderia metallica]
MIDIEKMKALAAFADRLRVEDTLCKHGGFTEEADLIYALLSELEAREADRRDAGRYRWLRKEHFPTADHPPIAQVVWKAFDDRQGNTWANMIDGDDLDRAIDAALAQRQGEEK